MNNNTNHPRKDLKSPDHFFYVLRLWQTNGQWRASLEKPETRERVGFANLEQFFAYLMNLIEEKDTPDDPEATKSSCGCASAGAQ